MNRICLILIIFLCLSCNEYVQEKDWKLGSIFCKNNGGLHKIAISDNNTNKINIICKNGAKFLEAERTELK